MDDFDLSPPPPSKEHGAPFSGKESRGEATRRLANERIAKMRQTYGRDDEHKCGDCQHLLRLKFSKTYLKCKVYGVSKSEASDWKAKWPACGKFQAVEKV